MLHEEQADLHRNGEEDRGRDGVQEEDKAVDDGILRYAFQE